MPSYAQPVLSMLLSVPFYLVVLFCCYSLFVIGVGLATFPECPEAATELKRDIDEARKALREKGVPLE